MTTRTLTLRSIDIPSIQKFGIGFDGMINEFMRITEHQQTNYPPYNVVKVTDNNFYVELAVAGFLEGEIKIELENRVLTVTGTKFTVANPMEYLYQGISKRDFVREFQLAEYIEVVDADISNGILTITLERQVPEDKKPKSIDIRFSK